MTYQKPEDTDHTYRFAMVEDDGSGLRSIFSGQIPQVPRSNGVRYLPFTDNCRILLGDYVLECRPNIDTCRQAELVPIRYPVPLYDDPNVTHRWSQVIFSPDERLGIVMSTRFSPRTDPAILGLLPRPYGTLALGGMIWYLYTHCVTWVRDFRPGNIGPALVEIQRSMQDRSYLGIQLNTDENWVYCSPMSWHPDGRRVM